jgi:quercetin dioxygenase-like cupin family protein
MFALFAALVTWSVFGASAQDVMRTEQKKADLSGTNMEIIINISEVPPGGLIPRHFHHGGEAFYVLELPNGQPA